MSIFRIISENQKTFYDFDTGRRRRQWPRFLLFLISASILSFGLQGDLKDLLSGILNVLSIVCGFSFTTLFFLVSDRGLQPKIDTDVREDKEMAKKLRILSNEIFYNVSYFIIIATTAIVLAMTHLIPSGSFSALLPSACPYWAAEKLCSFADFISNSLSHTIKITSKIIFLFALIECIYTFVRIVKRINFLFKKRMLG